MVELKLDIQRNMSLIPLKDDELKCMDKILEALSGLSIFQANCVLDKCKEALAFSKFDYS